MSQEYGVGKRPSLLEEGERNPSLQERWITKTKNDPFVSIGK